MKGWCAASAALLAAVGCFEAHGDATAVRLRKVHYVPEGGGEPWLGGWYDTELGVDCRFGPDTAGVDRCMPGWLVSWTTAHFADASCSEPLLRSQCAPPRYAAFMRWVPFAGCGAPPAPSREHIPYRVGERAELDRVYRSTAEGGCEEASPPEAPLYALVPIDVTELVSAAVVTPADADGRLTQNVYRTEEGTEHRFGVFEPGRGACAIVPSSPLYGGPDLVACLRGPRIDAWRRCETVYGLLPECGAPDTELAVEVTGDACGRATGVTLYTVGEPLDPADLGEGCSAPDGRDVVALEPALPGTGLWFSDRVRGDGRIRRHFLEHPELTIPWQPYEDVELDLPCTPVPAGDGEVRCLPTYMHTPESVGTNVSIFADSACTEPARLRGSCRPILVVPSGSCDVAPTFYRTTHPLDRAYERDDSGACVEAALGPDHDPWAMEMIPLDRFARFERVLR